MTYPISFTMIVTCVPFHFTGSCCPHSLSLLSEYSGRPSNSSYLIFIAISSCCLASMYRIVYTRFVRSCYTCKLSLCDTQLCLHDTTSSRLRPSVSTAQSLAAVWPLVWHFASFLCTQSHSLSRSQATFFFDTWASSVTSLSCLLVVIREG